MHSGTLEITHSNVNETTTPVTMGNKKESESYDTTENVESQNFRLDLWKTGKEACHWCNLQYAAHF